MSATEYQKAYQRRVRAERKAAGLCMICGRNRVRRGRVDCSFCAVWRKRYTWTKKLRDRAARVAEVLFSGG